MIIRLLVISTLAALATGCATASFSPPSTNIVNEMEVRGGNWSFAKRCKPQERLKDGTEGPRIPILRDASGAITLTNNFIYEYRCASHSAGNSRQAFEIPGFIGAIGSAAALAFGAGPDVAIAGGAATATADGAKDYYAPLAKAAIYDSALDAFLCIKSTATGTQPFVIGGENVLRKVHGEREIGAGPVLASSDENDRYFSPERRFFELISAALFTVERISADRLRNAGKYDPAGIAAQIEKLNEESDEAETDENKTENDQMATALALGAEDKSDGGYATSQDIDVISTSLDRLDLLQPKIELCVLRAKI